MSDASSIGSILNARVESNARDTPRPNLQIIELPADLERGVRPERIRGEVVRVLESNEITVRTDRGDIRAQPQGDVRATLSEGTTVDIRLDAGSPRETAYIKPTQQRSTEISQERNVSSQVRNIKLAPAQTVEQVVQSATAYSLARLPASVTDSVVQPFISATQSTTTNITSSRLPPSFIAIAPEISAFVVKSALNDALPSFILPPSSALATDSPFTNTQFNAPVVDVPFSIIAAQILTTPPDNLISVTNETSPVTPLLNGEIKQSFVDAISPPMVRLSSDAVPIQADQFVRSETVRAGEVRAVLVGFSAEQHFPVLEITTQGRFSGQLYVLDTPLHDVAVGREFSLNIAQIDHAAPLVATSSALLPMAPTYFLTPDNWPVFQETMATLTASAARVSAQMVLPSASTPANIAPAALFFIAAMRSGDVNGWLGERAVEALRTSGKGGLIERMGREMLGLARLNGEPVSQDWRALSLPLAWQDEVHKLVVHYRQESERHRDDDADQGENTRFIMDLSLSQMGKVQLDALFGRRHDAARLDLILRTENSFSESMKQQMRESYSRALKETSITGELSFQGDIESWVRITPDIISEYSRDI